jgi:hypothetical protein
MDASLASHRSARERVRDDHVRKRPSDDDADAIVAK